MVPGECSAITQVILVLTRLFLVGEILYIFITFCCNFVDFSELYSFCGTVENLFLYYQD